VIAPFSLLVGIQIVGAFVNDNSVWGFNLWAIFPPWAVIAVACGYALLSVPSVSLTLYAGIARVIAPAIRYMDRMPRWSKWVLVTAVFASLAWVLRSRALVYGDGFTAISISDRPGSDAFASLHDYYRPLVILAQLASQSLRYLGVESRESIFWIMSVAEGVAGWLGLVWAVRSMTSDSASRSIILLTAMTSGCVVLLLGWVELYVFPTALLLWLLASAITYVRQNGSFWPVCLFGLLAVLSSALVAPVALMILVVAAKLRGQTVLAKVTPRPRILFVLVALFAVGLGVVINLLSQVNFVVPLLATPINPYWTLSPRHLADLANLALFVIPACLSLFVLLALRREYSQWLREPTAVLLGLAGWTCLLVSFWLNPVLGAARDWDLLSFFGLPLSLLTGYFLTKVVVSDRQRHLLIVQLCLVASVLLIPNLYEKTHLDAAVRRLEPLTWNDIHYQPGYYRAHRCLSFGMILHQNCGRTDLAEKYFRRRIQAKPDCEFGWYNLGVVLFAKQQYVEASECFGRALELNPTSQSYRNSLDACLYKELQLQLR